jgi:hypothetical protein
MTSRIIQEGMDKKDAIYGISALVFILVIALVIKPAMTGHPVNTGIPNPVTSQPTLLIQSSTPVTLTTIPTIPTMISVPSPAPTPVPTWDNSVKSVGFVNSSVYGILPDTSVSNGSRYDNLPENTSMTSFAKITGQYSGTTQIIKMPFPYWELVYSVDPVENPKPESVAVTPVEGSTGSRSGVQGSYSGATPQFVIQVMDADDPNRIVRTISPPGGIDINLWKGIKDSVNPATTLRGGRATTSTDTVYNDPRPWTEKFFEGQRNYFFIIKSELISSYSIDIQVPTKYIGHY